MSELQGENHKLYELINRQKSKELAKRHHTSMDRSVDMSLKTRNMSCEDSSPRNELDDSYRYAAYDNNVILFLYREINKLIHRIKK